MSKERPLFPPSLRSRSAVWPTFPMSRSRSPSLSISPAESERLSIAADGDAGQQSYLFKNALTFIVKKKIWRRVVSHVDIGPAVAVVVAKDDTEPFAFGVVDPRFTSNILERAVTVVAIENV